jgi:hypothetical protein
MKKKIIIGLFLAGIIAAVGVYYYAFILGSKHKDPLKSENKIAIKAKDLFALYVLNEDSANRLYLDSVISVSGKVEEVALTEGRYTVTFQSGDSTGAVICEMDKVENDKIKSVKKDDEITIVGFCNGWLIDVQLDRCKLVE